MFRFAVIGAASIAHRFVEAVRLVGDADVVAVASRTPGKAEAFAARESIAAYYSDYEEMLIAEKPDCAYIATTPNFHFDNTMLCLRHGIPVLCEKAMLLSSAQADEVFALSEEKGIFVMEAMWSRFLKPVRKAEEWMKNGCIGEPSRLECYVGTEFNREHSKRIFDPALAGGAMYDLTCYTYEIADYLFGADDGNAEVSADWEDSGIDVTDRINLKYGDRTAYLFSSCVTRMDERCVIYGSRGKIVVPCPHYGNIALLYDADDNLVEEFTDTVTKNGFTYEIEETIRCIREGKIESDVCPHSMTKRCCAVFDRINVGKRSGDIA